MTDTHALISSINEHHTVRQLYFRRQSLAIGESAGSGKCYTNVTLGTRLAVPREYPRCGGLIGLDHLSFTMFRMHSTPTLLSTLSISWKDIDIPDSGASQLTSYTDREGLH